MQRLIKPTFSIILISTALASCASESDPVDESGDGPTLANSASDITLATGGCQIYNSTCPNQPAYAGYWFADNYDNANNSPFRCAQRGIEYRAWCGQTGSGDYTYSASIEASTQARTYSLNYAPISGCAIWNDVCPNHPEYATTWFADSYNGAATSASSCSQRADDYRAWCGTSRPGVDRTLSYFTATGATHRVLSNGCQINIAGACRSNPSLSYGTFSDASGTAAGAGACLKRGSDYRSYCGSEARAISRAVGSSVQYLTNLPGPGIATYSPTLSFYTDPDKYLP
jgi:hypothetical protein